MKVITVAFLMGTFLPSIALASAPVSPSVAASELGQKVTVEGIATIHEDPQQPGKDVDLTGKNNNRIVGFIPAWFEHNFSALGSYNGRVVDITGIVKHDSGRAQILVMSPDQLVPLPSKAG
jgi:hypothetical protein